jgi:fatty-acyl-CoA synthase
MGAPAGPLNGSGRYSRIAGRLKDMIIRSVDNIYPRESEDVLFVHPAVAEVAVVPDAVRGEQVAAFVRAAPGSPPSEADLEAHCRRHLAPHTTPRHRRFVDGFPLTGSGKILKFRLREQCAADTTPEAG